MVRLLKLLLVVALLLVVVVPAATIGFAWWDGSRLIGRAETVGLLPQTAPEGETLALTPLEQAASVAVFGRTWDVTGVPCRTGARFWLNYVAGGDKDGLSVSQVIARDIDATLEPGWSLRSQVRQLGAACLLESAHSDAALLRAWLAMARFGTDAAGADAAAQALFGKPANALSGEEATRLLALLYQPGLNASADQWERTANAIADRTAETALGVAAYAP